MDNHNFISIAAHRTLDLLHERKAMLYPDGTVFWVWEREERAVIVFDPNAIDLGKVNEDFAHRLSTRLKGRRVVRTNTRGLFLQIGYEIPPAVHELAALPLNLDSQPTPFDMPVGETRRGMMWVSLTQGDSFLVAGSRGYGKSNLLQGWIQALLRGGQVLIYAYDGKQGVEFSRYMGLPNFNYISNLAETLRELFALSTERRRVLLKSGFQNIGSYNAAHPKSMIPPVALFVDEAALASEEEREMLVRLVERERDTGFHPIYGTNRPEAATLLVKSNLSTRICFPVPSWNASQMALGMNGAEKLEKVPGRGLILHRARLTEFQSSHVDLPEPTEEAKAFVDQQAERVSESAIQAQVSEPAAPRDEIAELAEKIRGQWSEGMSKNRVAQLLGWKQYGGGIMQTVNSVIAYLTSTSTSTTQNMPKNGVFGAIEA